MAEVTAYACDKCSKHLEANKGFEVRPIHLLGGDPVPDTVGEGFEEPPYQSGGPVQHLCGECLHRALAQAAKDHNFRFVPPPNIPRGGPGDR